jgi:hypothetical protein
VPQQLSCLGCGRTDGARDVWFVCQSDGALSRGCLAATQSGIQLLMWKWPGLSNGSGRGGLEEAPSSGSR